MSSKEKRVARVVCIILAAATVLGVCIALIR